MNGIRSVEMQGVSYADAHVRMNGRSRKSDDGLIKRSPSKSTGTCRVRMTKSQQTNVPFEWIGIDLDDTLHRFTKASRNASTSVFECIRNKYPDLSVNDLRDCYKQICKEYVTSFTDGRSSRLYRLERMQQLLQRSGIPIQSADELVDVYAGALERSLSLEPGASDLLQKLKSDGHKVAVITEGPHDAQQWTIEKLGLTAMVDQLVTSNKERVSKKDGLFDIFMKQVNAQAHQCLIVGDSIENDIIPATKSGLTTIYYDPEKKNINSPATYTINHLQDVLEIVGDCDRSIPTKNE